MQEYDATYQFGKVTVQVVAPPPLTAEARLEIVRQAHLAAWEAWNLLPAERRLTINAQFAKQENGDWTRRGQKPD